MGLREEKTERWRLRDFLSEHDSRRSPLVLDIQPTHTFDNPQPWENENIPDPEIDFRFALAINSDSRAWGYFRRFVLRPLVLIDLWIYERNKAKRGRK